MTRDHRVEDIASQAELSKATVDRVLHGRPGASARAVRAVEQAVLDLDRQQTQLRLGARTVVLDVIIQAPQRFSTAYREAVEAQLGSVRPAAVRARFRFAEHADAEAAVTALDQVGARGRTSHGVLLKAPDDPEVATAVRRLADRGVPVVTLVTDVHASGRVAYVGLDNRSAGATAAYLVARWLGDRRGDLLVTLSRSAFFGESERYTAFRETLHDLAPRRRVVAITETEGLDATLGALTEEALQASPTVVGAYSIGGGNRAIVEGFAAAGRPERCIWPMTWTGTTSTCSNSVRCRPSCTTTCTPTLGVPSAGAAVPRVASGVTDSASANVQVVTPYNIPGRLPPR